MGFMCVQLTVLYCELIVLEFILGNVPQKFRYKDTCFLWEEQ
jgi:hypothetical protein